MTRIATGRGWLVSRVKVDYDGPAAWTIAYLDPWLGNASLVQHGGALWRRAGAALPRRMTEHGVVQQVSAAAGSASAAPPGLGNYSATNLGGGTVAGRPVTIIGLVDKDDGRLVRAFWTDNATGVFLRQDLLDPDGRLVSSTEFTKITFPEAPVTTAAIPPGEPKRPRDCSVGVRMDLAELSRSLGFRVRIPAAIPPGYRLKESYLLPCGCGCSGASAGLHFSDGVRSLSVFETDGRGTSHVARSFAGLAGKVVPGPSPALKAAVASHDGILFVVIGDLSADRLRRIAASY